MTIPAVSSHAGLTPAERAKAGISAGLIRVRYFSCSAAVLGVVDVSDARSRTSVGLEHIDDIWADFKAALDCITSKL